MSYLFQPDPKPSEKNSNEKFHMRFTICVSGASKGKTTEDSAEMAEQLGAEIAKHGHILSTGATSGLPYSAAKGAKKHGGMSVGFSPASSLREHLRKYRLPFNNFDYINFTGMNYVGRDLYLIQSSDAIITIGGRFGSLHEFASAIEAGKPCGVLLGSGGTADLTTELLEKLEHPKKSLIVFDTNPVKLIQKIEAILEEEYKDIHEDYKKGKKFWYVEGTDY